MRYLTAAFSVLAAMLIASASLAAEASSAKSEAKPDPRLTQKVTYQAKNLPLTKILDELSEKTGVKMVAGTSQKDWQVRDRRMNVFATDVTIADLQKSIADLMHFRWSRGGEEDKWYYRLWQDKRAIADEETKRAKAKEEYEKMLHDRRQAMLDDYKNLDKMTPEQIEKMKTDNPYMYFVAKSGVGKGMGQFFGNAPGAMDMLLNAQEGSIKMSDLPASAQQGLQSGLQSIAKMMGPGGGSEFINKTAGNLSKATIEFNKMKNFMAGGPQMSSILGDMTIKTEGSGDLPMPIIDPQSSMGKAMGKAFVRMLDGMSPDEAFKGMQGEMMTAIAADMAKDGAMKVEKEDPQPDDPALDKKIALKIENGKRLEEDLEELSKAASINIVSDRFENIPGLVKLDEKEITIKDALDKIAKPYANRWRKTNSIVTFQDKDWYNKRTAQVPDEWLKAWEEILKTRGTFDIDDMASIASLTDAQINTGLQENDAVRRASMPFAWQGRDLLRLYASLDSGQKGALMSEGGLSAHLLSADQWAALEKQIRAKNSALLPDPPIPLIMKLVSKQDGKVYVYTMTVLSPNSDQAASWELRSPEYKPREQKPEPPVEDKK